MTTSHAPSSTVRPEPDDARRAVARQDAMLAAVDVGTWYCDLPFGELTWDRKAKEHFWLPPDARVTIDTFYERLHVEDRERTRHAIERSIASHSPYDIEYRTVAPLDHPEAGTIRWVRAIGYTGYDSSGNPIRFDGVTVDISAAKVAAAALADAEAALRAATREEAEVVATLHRIGSTLAAEVELERIVQAVTDESTRLTNAQFGAFFYNVVNDKGETYTLYTLSGAPREAFANFPMPRNTAVFAPTFHGEGVVRSGDITKDPRYGKNAPYYGKPKGHLPVTSYLAVPITSHSGEVIGGLFFGHEQPDVFTERHEKLAVGVAGWATVAMDNARLFEAQRRAVALAREAETAARHAEAELHQAVARSRFVAEASAALLGGSLDTQSVLDRVARTVVPFVADYCLAYLAVPGGEATAVASAHADPTKQADAEAIAERYRPMRDNPNGPIAAAMRSGQPILIERVSSEMLERTAVDEAMRKVYRSLDPTSGYFVPLIARDRLLGTMAFVRSGARETFSAEDRAIAEEMSQRAAVALDNARLYDAARLAHAEAEHARHDAEQANRAKSDFLAKMSHDLRTPLNAIGGYSQLLGMAIHGPVNEAQMDALGRIQRAQQHLLTLINDILSFAKLEAGQVQIEATDVEMRGVIDELSTMIAPQARMSGLEMRIDAGPPDLVVRADRARLIQILLNLTSNAFKFTDTGWVEVRVAGAPDAVLVHVSDSGRGIPEHRLASIFDPFVQVRRVDDQQKGGAGLGLAISRELARLMGGAISVTSEEGRGSTFTLELPRGGISRTNPR